MIALWVEFVKGENSKKFKNYLPTIILSEV